MKIRLLEIKKFRSILKCKIHLNKISAIVGENNVGKTAILRAINAFFNFEEEKSGFIGNLPSHQYKSRSNSYITITFSDLEDTEELHKYIENGELCVQFKYEYSNNRRIYTCFKGTEKLNFDDDALADIKKQITFVYIPTSRSSISEEWKNDSVFGQLVKLYSDSLTSKRDTVSSKVNQTAKMFKKNILTKIEKQINDMYMIESDKKFRIDFNDQLNYSIFMRELSLIVEEYGRKLNVKEHGSGINSLAVIAMYRALAQLKDTNIILGIEEPETNLHPQGQKLLIHSLLNNSVDNEVQTIFTTHSTVVVDQLQHEDIILVRRCSESTRGFYSKVTQVSPDFWKNNNIEDIKVTKFFQMRNSDFFFSKYVYLFEGKLDARIFSELMQNELGLHYYDISFVELGSVNNLKYPMLLFDELQIPYSVVVDRDYFFSYKNRKKDDSRDDDGFYLYANTLENKNVEDIKRKLKCDNEEIIIKKLTQSYTSGFDFLRKENMYCMEYCLEMDLMKSNIVQDYFYDKLSVSQEDRNVRYLLTQCKKSIKSDYLYLAIKQIQLNDLPYSIKKIRRGLLDDYYNTIV